MSQVVPQATRSRSGCMTCRARKLRCDRTDPDNAGSPCGRCARLGVECVSSNNASLSQQERRQLQGDAAKRRDLNQAGFRRLRTAASCRHCRARRQKCSGDRPTCTRCLQSNQPCVYDRNNKTEATESPPNVSATIAVAAADEEGGTGVQSQSMATLKDKSVVRALVRVFFSEISPLRCFGFIHEPSFMLRMDYLLTNEDKDPLLLAVCALASRAINQSPEIHELGAAWAHTALTMVRSQAHRISVNILMSLVLLHEFFIRIDELSQCFILSCLACRLCQALQLNVEYDEDYDCTVSQLSATEKETRRRLMWACYILDSSTAGGLDSIKMFREADLLIQMPAEEDSFFYRTAGLTSFLKPVGQMGNQGIMHSPASTDPNVVLGGYRAYYVHLVVFRERVLRYLKRRTQEENPSAPMSEYNLLVADFEQWKACLPQNLRLTPEIIYIRKSQGMLSALLNLHTEYHQCGCDIYRAMIPELQLPPRRQNTMTLTAPQEFLDEARQKWYRHACELTHIFRLAMEHAPVSLAEPNTSGHAYTAIRTKLYYHLYIMTEQERQEEPEPVDDLISSDLEYLRQMHKVHPMTARTLACSEELVRTLDPRSGGAKAAEEDSSPNKLRQGSSLSGNETDSGHEAEARIDLSVASNASPQTTATPNVPGCLETGSQVSVDYILHPLTSFRVLRNRLPEKHTPEKVRTGGFLWNLHDNTSPANVAAPFLADPADMSQQQFSNAFWDLNENSFAWINADVQENDFRLSSEWFS